MIRKAKRYISPITLRILAVNIGALLILAFGLLYTGQYEREMIDEAQNSLLTEGRLLGAALAGGGARENLSGEPILTQDLSLHMLRKLSDVNPLRTILFAKGGKLLLDSNQLQGPGGAIDMVELDPPFASWPISKKISYSLEKALKLIPTRLEIDKFPREIKGIETYPGMIAALRGEESSGTWYDEDGHILLTASLPVQNLKDVMGAVMVQRSGKDIENAVHAVQITVLKLFLWALVTTLLLSIYLTETIGIPILRLADAAEKVEQSLLLKESIPNFSYRHDEIGVLSAALRSMTTALAERIDAIGAFAADVAHELKNPLASLKGAVEAFVMVNNDPARQKKLLSIIVSDVDRMDRLISDISAASRLDSEINRAQKITFDLTKFLQNIVRNEIENMGLKGKLMLDIEKDQRFVVSGNEFQLGQVIDNIVQNAASFIPTNGKITIACQMQKDKIVLHVDNNGPPIPDGKLETIFERFYSERPASERFGLHSGLGLSISRQIIRAHNGAIFARNLSTEKGQHLGVRFTIILPAEGIA
jgi:two-component system sensor histidine kinase ChvG